MEGQSGSQAADGCLLGANSQSRDSAFRDSEVLRYVANCGMQGATSIFRTMLKSDLLTGNQPAPRTLDSLVYDPSNTDACIDWATTERLVLEIAETL